MFSFNAKVMKTLQDPGLSSEDVQNAINTKSQVSFLYTIGVWQWIQNTANFDLVEKDNWANAWVWGFVGRAQADYYSLLLCPHLKGLWMSKSMCSPLMKSSPSPGWTPMVSLRCWKKKVLVDCRNPLNSTLNAWFFIWRRCQETTAVGTKDAQRQGEKYE